MSRVFSSSGNTRLDIATDLGITAYPLTIAVWEKVTAYVSGIEQCLVLFANDFGAGHYFQISHDTSQNSGHFKGRSIQNSARVSNGTVSPNTGVWQPVVFRMQGTKQQLDGAGETITTIISSTYQTNSSPHWYIGQNSAGGNKFGGKLAHLTIWPSYLSDADVASFLAGDLPSGISSPSHYWAFTDGNLVDSIGSATLSNTGTTNDDADNPTISGGFTPGPGTTPKEGRALIANLVYKNADANRGTSLQLGLITNSTVLDENATLDQITEPTSANGYARKTLVDADWTVAVPDITYALQQFTASGGSFSAPIYGWFICTTGTAPKLLHFQQSSGAPYTISDGKIVSVPLNETIG